MKYRFWTQMFLIKSWNMEYGFFWCGDFDDKLARLSLPSNITDKRGTTILSCWKISMMDVLNYRKFLMFIYSASSRNRYSFLHPHDAQHSRSTPSSTFIPLSCMHSQRETYATRVVGCQIIYSKHIAFRFLYLFFSPLLSLKFRIIA